jgi:hypothetical protein
LFPKRGECHALTSASFAAVALGGVVLIAAYHRTNSASVMCEPANRFLAALTPEQRAKATFSFEDAERSNWFFVPIERKGLPAAAR